MHALGDLRFAVRSLRKRPGFCLLAILTLTLGTAGAASLFSFVNSWVLKPVPGIDANRTMYLRSVQALRGRNLAVSLADLHDWREQNKSLDAVAGFSQQNFALQSQSEPEMLSGVAVTRDFFNILGARLELGRPFLASEEVFGNHHAVIVSNGFWRTRLGGRPDALGRTIRLDGEDFTVVGVLPEKFHFPLVGRANLWVPVAVPPADADRRGNRFLQALAVLKPGVSFEQAKSDLTGIAAALAARFPATNKDVGVRVRTLVDELGDHTGNDKVLVLLAIAVGLMLIACSNVGNLLLVRALGRRREAAIQLSLGASRGRVIGQALAESLMLFGAAAILSTALGMWLTDWVSGAIPFENRGYLPNYGVVHMDWTVFSAILGFSLLCGLAFGVGPAWEGIKVNLGSMLKEGGAAASGGRRHVWLRGTLVVGQVLLATLLLTLTGVLIQNFSSFWTTNAGFSAERLLAFRVSLDAKQYATPLARLQYMEKALTALAALPLDGAPAASRFIPFGQDGGGTTVLVEGRANQDAAKAPSSGFNAVSNSFFATFRTPVLGGRVFETRDSDTSPLVVVVNDSLARELFAGQNPIGQKLILSRLRNRSAEIVGVVQETRERPDRLPGQWQLYVPAAQAPFGDVVLTFRAKSDPLALVPAARAALAQVDRSAPVYDIKTLDARMAEQFSPYQILVRMVTGFGLLALALAAIGVYGVISFTTSQRTKELGIRVALGADRRTLVGLVMNRGVKLVLFGLIPGLAVAYAATRALQSVMAEIQKNDPWIYVGILFGLGLVGSIAVLIPAWRASQVDPLVALRNE